MRAAPRPTAHVPATWSRRPSSTTRPTTATTGSNQGAQGVAGVLYVSTGIDEDDLQLVCGLAAAPDDGPEQEGGVGHQLAWSHGTIGLQQACLPCDRPAEAF